MGDSLSESVLPLFSIVGVQDRQRGAFGNFDLWREVEGEKWLVFSVGREDIFRKYVRGVRVADLGKRGGALALFLSKGAGRSRHGAKMVISRSAFEYGGRSRERGWSGELSAVDWAGRLEYVLDRERYRAGFSAVRYRSSGRDQRFNLEAFHRSPTDQRMNEFFWELLEPTFGEEIDYSWEDSGWDVEVGGRADLAEGERLGVTVRWRERGPRADVRYFNSGSKAALSGLRRADLRQEFSRRRYELAYQRRLGRDGRGRAEWGYVRRRLGLRALQRDVPQSASGVLLDRVELGDGRGSGRGLDMKVRVMWERPARLHLEAVLGWGRSSYEARGQGSTPVLGFRLRTLPISHQADADLAGEVETGFGGVLVRQAWRGMRLEVGTLSARAQVEARTRADAQMEFGLIVRPVRDVSRYRVWLHRFSAAPSVQLSDRLLAEYQVAQYLVDIIDRDRVGPKPERDEKTRGGLVQILTLKYTM